MLESGPAAGVIGAKAVCDRLGLANAIAFDMGGTTAKCILIEGGEYAVQSSYHIGGEETGFPIRGNVIDIVGQLHSQRLLVHRTQRTSKARGV